MNGWRILLCWLRHNWDKWRPSGRTKTYSDEDGEVHTTVYVYRRECARCGAVQTKEFYSL